MSPDDTPSAEPDDADAASAPEPMSVDRLTQAFAQLMGDDDPHVSQSESPAEAPTADGADVSSDLLEDDAEDGGVVTPASIIEALLFVGHPLNEPLTSRQMASYLRGISPQEVDALVQGLNERYAEQQTAYHVVSVGAGYRMTLRDEFARLREGFYGRIREAKLTQAAVDLLAIVAYHQPISREDIDRLRGQASGAPLAQLVRRELLEVEYTSTKPRKKVYRTTDRFLDLFGLESLEDLPSHEDF